MENKMFSRFRANNSEKLSATKSAHTEKLHRQRGNECTDLRIEEGTKNYPYILKVLSLYTVFWQKVRKGLSLDFFGLVRKFDPGLRLVSRA